MRDRNPRTCLHPACDFVVKRGQSCCRRHFRALPDELRNRLARAREVEEIGAIKIEAIDYFRSRMIGSNEIVTCKGKDCGQDVVWLTTSTSGRGMLVDVAGVEASDHYYDPKRHVSHFATCPNANDFRRKREPGGSVPPHHTDRYLD